MNNPYSSVSNDAAERAKALLVHYFQLSNDNSLDSDCVTEIANAVQYIIDAAVEQQPEKRLKRLEQDVKSFERLQRQQVQLLVKASSTFFRCLEHLPPDLIEKVESLSGEIEDYLHD